MITYRELRWGDAFSYGPKNVLRLDDAQLTQIVGKNGHGKSTIGLLLEEAQFNTNSKKIKKANVLNRYSKSKTYFIELDFDKDNDHYTIITNRSSTAGTVKLLRNGVDISNHTATGTYANIVNILGYDFTAFGQIVYQSSIASLEFLTATDTARKTFLINLLNLTHYGKASDVFKKLASDIGKRADVEVGKVSTVTAWLKRYETEDLTPAVTVPEPDSPTEEVKQLASTQNVLSNIVSTNKKINTNNAYITILEGLELPSVVLSAPSNINYVNSKAKLISKQAELKHAKAHTIGSGICNTCKQTIDNSQSMIAYDAAQARIPLIEADITALKTAVTDYETYEKQYTNNSRQVAEYEKYHALVDHSVSTELLDKEVIEAEIVRLNKVINTANEGINAARKINTAAAAHNSKIKVITEQMDSMKSDLEVHSAELVKLSDELANLQVLVKAFSTTGLVAYKIECLIKDLEELTNKYLSELADGRFQLSFKIASADKLNVVITDNGQDIEITALSTGERARVNVATLLAIRSLMQGLSNSRTNLLILDETISNLDTYGKEKLIEMLLKEDNLNTFIISHDFTHPLLEKITVTKTNGISRLEYV